MDRRENNRMLRRCPLAIAQQLVYYAVAVSTAVRNRVTKTMSIALPAVEKQLRQKKSNFQAQLHLPALDLVWANLKVQLHLPALGLFWANLKVQHHLPLLDLAWTRLRVKLRNLTTDILFLKLCIGYQ